MTGLTQPATFAAVALAAASFLLTPQSGAQSTEGPAALAATSGGETREDATDATLTREIEAVAGLVTSADRSEEPGELDPAAVEVDHTEGAAGTGLGSPLDDSELRRRKVQAHRPAAVEHREGSLLPVELRRELRARLGRLQEAIPDYDGARTSYATAIGLGLDRCQIWRALGRTRVRAGLLDAAEGALLAALEQGFCNMDVYRELGELYLLTHRPALAETALERALELAPGALRTEGLLARARFELDPASRAPPDSFWPVWPLPPDGDWRARLESALRSAEASLPARARVPLARVLRPMQTPRGRAIALAVAGGLALLWLVARLRRRRGDLVVSIEYPGELRGTFTVQLAAQAGRRKRSGRGVRASVLKGGVSTGTEHHLVSRETQFRRLPPRRYFVSVEGVIQDPTSQEILKELSEEQEIQVRGRMTARIEFDFRPEDCPVDVKVMWEKRPARDAGVAVRGVREAVRYSRGGAVRLQLKRGSHTLMVGSGDRVTERLINVDSFSAMKIQIDLSSGEGVVFKGCPPAVEAYLQGDVTAAAGALDREGQTAQSHLLLARMHREQGRAASAASHFESAGRPLEAAELRASLEEHRRAAELYSEGGDSLRAAEMFRKVGDLVLAGEAYEAARDLESAIRCYREVGDTGRWIDALERRGEAFEAAQVALEHGNRTRTVRLLQLVSPDDPHYSEACSLLADAFELEGHREMAAQKLEEHIITAGPHGSLPDRHSHLAELLEQTEEYDRAVEALERLRQREPTYPNVATRIELLRKKISERELADSLGRTGPPAVENSGGNSAPTAWIDETRYELLEEIGRGGMGVVFKARDKRLGRVVALKRLPDNLRDHPKAIQLFLREAQSSAQLSHPNIITVYDADQADGNFFITMELLQGYPLNVILKRKHRLPVVHAARLIVQAAAGLHHAHEQRIVHRDIKPANLFLTRDKVLKIMDFGLAKMIEEVRRGTTIIGGTPYYMAPEQSAGQAVDHRADVYALGVTLFECVTGQVPFSEGDVTYHHRHTPAPDPRTVNPELPAELAELILHMLVKDVEGRCASVAEVAERLQVLT